MRIQHNIAALNSYRNLSGNNSSVSKNLEKLSSGYRINRAGDDAAGLAISEKMRAQITGLKTAQKNSNDGISLVQTAEGALTEVHSMLNRMVELADQSANGTYDNETDRANLQKEVDSLKSEIDRISEGTNFNGINLLDGSLSATGGAASSKAVSIQNATVTTVKATQGSYKAGAAINANTVSNLANSGDKLQYEVTYKNTADGTSNTVSISLTLQSNNDGTADLVSSTGKSYRLTGATPSSTELEDALGKELNNSVLSDMFNMKTAAGTAYEFESKEYGSSGAVVESITEKVYSKEGTLKNDATAKLDGTNSKKGVDSYKQLKANGITAYDGTNANKAVFTVNGKQFVLAATSGTDVTNLDKNVTVLYGDGSGAFDATSAKVLSQTTGLNVTVNANDANTLDFKPATGVAGSGGLTLQIGDTSDSFNQLTVSVGNMSAASLGVGSIDVSTQGGAKAAVDMIKSAINKVSSTRGDLGAIQNRLEHTINNLGVTTENMTAAESRIRDVDMADEMMNYTKNNILVQASQAMLAQANQIPQGVLQLLQ